MSIFVKLPKLLCFFLFLVLVIIGFDTKLLLASGVGVSAGIYKYGAGYSHHGHGAIPPDFGKVDVAFTTVDMQAGFENNIPDVNSTPKYIIIDTSVSGSYETYDFEHPTLYVSKPYTSGHSLDYTDSKYLRKLSLIDYSLHLDDDFRYFGSLENQSQKKILYKALSLAWFSASFDDLSDLDKLSMYAVDSLTDSELMDDQVLLAFIGDYTSLWDSVDQDIAMSHIRRQKDSIYSTGFLLLFLTVLVMSQNGGLIEI